jgi:hypothetical protein
VDASFICEHLLVLYIAEDGYATKQQNSPKAL